MNQTNRKFLDSVYDVKDDADTRTFYADWADTYDQEVTGEGYITPRRCAAALAQYAPDQAQPILDLCCGTGLSGMALREAGFSVIDGVDFSMEMLTHARRQNVYRRTFLHDLSKPLALAPGTVAHAVAVGGINPGHAPPIAIDHSLAAIPVGGLLVFSLNDHALADAHFEGRVHANVDCGAAELLFREYGEHLPGVGLKAMVYALRRRS